jgi:hypothetical protein
VARFGVVLLLLARPALASSGEDCALSGACCFPRGEPRARFVSAPTPRFATLTSISVSDGGLGRPVVKRVLSGRTAALGACTARDAELRAHIVVAPSGAAIVGGVTGGPEIAACVTEALRSARFPSSTRVTQVDVRVTW